MLFGCWYFPEVDLALLCIFLSTIYDGQITLSLIAFRIMAFCDIPLLPLYLIYFRSVFQAQAVACCSSSCLPQSMLFYRSIKWWAYWCRSGEQCWKFSSSYYTLCHLLLQLCSLCHSFRNTPCRNIFWTLCWKDTWILALLILNVFKFYLGCCQLDILVCFYFCFYYHHF